MLVGHEPDFGKTVGKLIGCADVAIDKGGLAGIELANAKARQGKLLYIATPEMLESPAAMEMEPPQPAGKARLALEAGCFSAEPFAGARICIALAKAWIGVHGPKPVGEVRRQVEGRCLAEGQVDYGPADAAQRRYPSTRAARSHQKPRQARHSSYHIGIGTFCEQALKGISMQTAALAGRILPSLLELRERAVALEQAHIQDFERINPFFRDSACNLVHYLALRQVDLRPLQDELTALGLSSLGRIEAHVMSSLNAVLVAAGRLAGRDWLPPAGEAVPADHRTGPLLLQEHTRTLFGTPSGKRAQQIMVTMPSEAATDYELNTPGLTAKDLTDLAFLVQHVGYHRHVFVRRPRDVFELEDHLKRLQRRRSGHRARDRNSPGLPEPAAVVARQSMLATGRGYRRTRRPGCGGRL